MFEAATRKNPIARPSALLQHQPGFSTTPRSHSPRLSRQKASKHFARNPTTPNQPGNRPPSQRMNNTYVKPCVWQIGRASVLNECRWSNKDTHPCEHIRNRNCTLGSKCPFRGLPNDVCIAHLEGWCAYGDRCTRKRDARDAWDASQL